MELAWRCMVVISAVHLPRVLECMLVQVEIRLTDSNKAHPHQPELRITPPRLMVEGSQGVFVDDTAMSRMSFLCCTGT
jgi:hypothetical protein